MSKLKETIALYEQSRAEVLELKKAVTAAEEEATQAGVAVQRARSEAQAKIERARMDAEGAAARDIHAAEETLADRNAYVDVLRRDLKRRKAALLQAANDMPRLVHADVAGVVGAKQEPVAEQGGEATAAE